MANYIIKNTSHSTFKIHDYIKKTFTILTYMGAINIFIYRPITKELRLLITTKTYYQVTIDTSEKEEGSCICYDIFVNIKYYSNK